jgi:hypothetical protein
MFISFHFHPATITQSLTNNQTAKATPPPPPIATPPPPIATPIATLLH